MTLDCLCDLHGPIIYEMSCQHFPPPLPTVRVLGCKGKALCPVLGPWYVLVDVGHLYFQLCPCMVDVIKGEFREKGAPIGSKDTYFPGELHILGNRGSLYIINQQLI